MWKNLSKKQKTLIVIISVIAVILIAIPLFAKNYINNNGKELVGRELNISSIYLNYFTGGVTIKDFVLYEENAVDTFLLIEKLHVNPNVTSCIRSNYLLDDIEVDGVRCNIILSEDHFNFDGLIAFFDSGSDTVVVEESEPVRYGVENMILKNSEITYTDHNLNSFVAMEDLFVSIPNGVFWDNPEVNVVTNFGLQSGGQLNSELDYNMETGMYNMALRSDQLKIDVLLPYLQEFMNTRDIGGEFNADLLLSSKSQDALDIDIMGSLGVDGIYINDTTNSKVMGLDRMVFRIDTLNPAKDVYEIEAIKLNRPYFKYEAFTLEDDNVSRLLISTDTTVVSTEEEYSSNVFVMIKDYFADAVQQIKASNFTIDTLMISDVNMEYIDHTMIDHFEYLISDTDLKAINVSSEVDSIFVTLSSLLNNSGTMKANSTLYPNQPEDVIVEMKIDDLSMTDLSPYFLEYLAYPVLKGTGSVYARIDVNDMQLKSENNLTLNSLTLGKKQKHDKAMKLPFKTAVAALKNREGHILIDIPVEGDLSDPEYKIWKTVGSIFKELLLKAAISPYKAVADGVSGPNEKSVKKISVETVFDEFDEGDYSKFDQMAEVLRDIPEIKLLVNPYFDLQTQAKKQAMVKTKAGFLAIPDTISFSKSDWERIHAVDENDPLFADFVNANTAPENSSLALEDRVLKLYDPVIMERKIRKRIKLSVGVIHNYLVSKGVPKKQLTQLVNPNMIFHDKTQIDDVEFHLMFEVFEGL